MTQFFSQNSSKIEPIFSIRDTNIFHAFLKRFEISIDIDKPSALYAISRAFSHIPYENLTKIHKKDELLTPSSAKRVPDEVLSDFLNYGTGGTCFSLTAAFVAVLRAFNIEAFPILADRRYGTDTHSAVLFIMNNSFFLLDPGYLIFEPLKVPCLEEVFYKGKFNNIRLLPKDSGKKVELYTEIGNDKKYRLTYKINPLDETEFVSAWEKSFSWEMMNYPVLTKILGNSHLYLQKDILTIKENGKNQKIKLDSENIFCYIVNKFGISPEIAKKALELHK